MSIGALIEKFRGVALDRIERMNLGVITLETNPRDTAASEALLREIHTLKGEAKMMGFADINLVAHQTEHLLMKAEEHEWQLSDRVTQRVFEGFDLMRLLLTKQAGAQDAQVDLSTFVDAVQVTLGGMNQRDEMVVPELGASISLAHEPSEVFFDESEDAQTGRFRQVIGGAAPAQRAARSRRDAAAVPDGGGLRIQAENSLRVGLETLERIGDVAGEVMLMTRRLDYQLNELAELRHELSEWTKLTQHTVPKSHMKLLRDLRNRLNDLTVASVDDNRLVHTRANQLDEQIRTLRHVPLAQVISHYPRAIRDLAHAQGKRVHFTHDTGHLAVDRAILSSLSDPLLHLVRNAVDHGIEAPEERERVGKPSDGVIDLQIEHIGDSLRLTLSDDGRGLDVEVLKARAIQEGIISAQEAALMSNEDARNLIFRAKFSTKREVSDVSGRGIGMDVVSRKVGAMGGIVEVMSIKGSGTKFMLTIPLSSAVIPVLVVRIGSRRFGVQAKDVDRVMRLQPSELVRVQGKLCVRHEGKLLGLLDSRPIFGGGGGDAGGSGAGELSVLLIKKGARAAAIWIDEVVGEREAINRPMGDYLKGVRLCLGVALTETGEAIALLNLLEVMRIGGAHQARALSTFEGQRAAEPSARVVLPRQRQVLVVEDSAVTREMVASVLRRQNYHVLEAEDGVQASRLMQEHRVDLVLTDIQMPNKDGLSLLREIRASARHDLPVVILSTLGSAMDRERGLRAGADAYLVKMNFEEQALLDVVRRHV